VPKLRVGIGDILDARPLAWGFLKGHHADLFASERHPLPLVGRLLARDGLDVGLLPSIDVARHPELRVLPELCVAFPGEARSLVLVSRTPFSELRRVYLGRSARTSAVALRVVLSERPGEMPDLVEEDAPVPTHGGGGADASRLRPGEAALLIGGAALQLIEHSPPGLHRLDLGAAWRDLTGTPLVAGVWAVRAGVTLSDLPFYFKSSLRYGLSCLDAIAREAAAELGLSSDTLARYLHEDVSFLLQDAEHRGLEELLRRAARLGEVPAGAAVTYWSA
jgi:chorismate dehydratase